MIVAIGYNCKCACSCHRRPPLRGWFPRR